MLVVFLLQAGCSRALRTTEWVVGVRAEENLQRLHTHHSEKTST